MRIIKTTIYLLYFLFFSCNKTGSNNAIAQNPLPLRGAEISFLPQVRQSGMVTKNLNGAPEDMLTTLANAGANAFRIKLWVNPADGHAGFDEVKTLAEEVKSKGLKVWLTVHYSDSWADPGQQTKPAAWASLSFDALKDTMYNYTARVVSQINPDYIQIGNEINGGLLWPD